MFDILSLTFQIDSLIYVYIYLRFLHLNSYIDNLHMKKKIKYEIPKQCKARSTVNRIDSHYVISHNIYNCSVAFWSEGSHSMFAIKLLILLSMLFSTSFCIHSYSVYYYYVSILFINA